VALHASRLCRTCGAPAEPGQEYCLECGNRILPPRRSPLLAVWIVPSLVALLVAAGGTAAAIAATRGRSTAGTRAIVAISRLQAAPAPRPRTTKKGAGGARTAQRLMTWPATNGYTIVLASLPLSAGAGAARAKALAALRDGLTRVGVLVSSSYPSLQPGYYVVFSGVYPSLAEAQSALETAKASFPAAYARPVAR
jgi:septal ring-binding cell division protein DamX